MRLGVNIDHVGTVREARKTFEPSPVRAAILAEMAGADSIVCHLREDRRHINDKDLKLLKEVVTSELNLEMALNEDVISVALDVKPDRVTIVPEKREELTTEGGLDVFANKKFIKEKVKLFNDAGIDVSLFIDPNPKQIEASKLVGASIVELHTGKYANAISGKEKQETYNEISKASVMAKNMRFFVAAGHGLNYLNVKSIAGILDIKELNIGHSIIARAVLDGISSAVKTMKDMIDSKRTI